MKKVLIYGTMAVVCVTGMFALTGCSNKEGSAGGESDKSGTTVVEESRPTEIILSDATDKWPSGVYDYYGIPEYTSGSLVYARPNNKYGDVYYQTTMDELDSYLKNVTNKGIRIDEKAKTDSYASYYMFDKDAGKGFYVSVEFENKKVDVNGESKDYNLYMSICEDAYPEKNIQKDLLVDYGFSDEEIIPQNVEVLTAEVLNYGAEKKVEFRTGFDVSVTEEDNKAYHAQIVDACAKLSDDGKLENLEGEKVSAQEVKDDFTTVWKYTINGKTHKINFTVQTGIGVSYNFVIQ